jgi:hypothetical protein
MLPMTNSPAASRHSPRSMKTMPAQATAPTAMNSASRRLRMPL